MLSTGTYLGCSCVSSIRMFVVMDVGYGRVDVLLDVRVLKTLCNDLVIVFFYVACGRCFVMICQVLFEPSWTCLLILLGSLVRICWKFLRCQSIDCFLVRMP